MNRQSGERLEPVDVTKITTGKMVWAFGYIAASQHMHLVEENNQRLRKQRRKSDG